MITGLQITIRGEDLSQRISERIRMHEATVGVLEGRIKLREGDLPFDVRVEDGFKTLGELESEREHYRGRVVRLTLLREGLVAGELYALSSADLRLAELVLPDSTDASGVPQDGWADDKKNAAIDGLKVTILGHELRTLLEQRIHDHERRAERWKHEQARTPEQETEDEPLLPEHMCANEAERHDWRADVLRFIRDHIEVAEIYRLGEEDLVFGELLPAKPEWIEQQEYEERTSVGFQLERLTRSVGDLVPRQFAFAAQQAHGQE
jgi:hypothetical protein